MATQPRCPSTTAPRKASLRGTPDPGLRFAWVEDPGRAGRCGGWGGGPNRQGPWNLSPEFIWRLLSILSSLGLQGACKITVPRPLHHPLGAGLKSRRLRWAKLKHAPPGETADLLQGQNPGSGPPREQQQAHVKSSTRQALGVSPRPNPDLSRDGRPSSALKRTSVVSPFFSFPCRTLNPPSKGAGRGTPPCNRYCACTLAEARFFGECMDRWGQRALNKCTAAGSWKGRAPR